MCGDGGGGGSGKANKFPIIITTFIRLDLCEWEGGKGLPNSAEKISLLFETMGGTDWKEREIGIDGRDGEI